MIPFALGFLLTHIIISLVAGRSISETIWSSIQFVFWFGVGWVLGTGFLYLRYRWWRRQLLKNSPYAYLFLLEEMIEKNNKKNPPRIPRKPMTQEEFDKRIKNV